MPLYNELPRASNLSASQATESRAADYQASESVAVAALVTADTQRTIRNQWSVRLWWSMAIAVALWCLIAGTASAQFAEFPLEKQFEAFKEPKKAAELERAVMQYKTATDASKVNSSVPSMVSFYLEKYIPWKLTQKENLPVLSSTIEGLLKDVDGAQRTKDSVGALPILRSTYTGMKVLAEGNYMPAVRINAINALSRLNIKPMVSGQSPPQPLPYSYTILYKLYTNEKENDGVRAAALHGLHYYTSLGFPYMRAEDRKALADEMNKLLAASPPASRNAQAHAYLQRFAVDILDHLRAPDDASLGTQLISLSTSEKQPDLIALYSASKLGSFDKGLQGKVTDPSAVTKQWSLRAFNALESELARFAAQTRPSPAQQQPPNPIDFLQKSAATARAANDSRRGMGSGMSGGGMGSSGSMDGIDMGSSGRPGGGRSGGRMSEMMDGMDMGMGSGYPGMSGGLGVVEANPQPPEVSLSRRHLSFTLQQLLRGATGSAKGEISDKPSGLIAAVADPQKAEIKQWAESVQEVLDALNDTSLDQLDTWLVALDEQRRPLGMLAGVEVKLKDDPDKIERRTGLPGFPTAPVGDAQPAGLPGLPGT